MIYLLEIAFKHKYNLTDCVVSSIEIPEVIHATVTFVTIGYNFCDIIS